MPFRANLLDGVIEFDADGSTHTYDHHFPGQSGSSILEMLYKITRDQLNAPVCTHDRLNAEVPRLHGLLLRPLQYPGFFRNFVEQLLQLRLEQLIDLDPC